MQHWLFSKPTRYILPVVFAAAGFLAAAGVIEARPDLNDITISDAVEDELMVDPGVPGYAIDVIANDGIVTLTGSVDNILARDRAGYIAETVKGVRAVVNQIKVNPAIDRSDADIKRDVELALAADPATDSYEVDVKVTGNRVQLTGAVDSWAERDLCATVAKGVKGVAAVDNLIGVQFKTQRADSEIQKDIEQRLRWNVLVDDGLIDVAVKGGKVSLSGTVGSAAEKREARMDAFVAGVKSVDDSRLKVARWARDEDLRKDKYVVKSDDDIRDAILDALTYDPRVLSFNVQVNVNRGIATLHGSVDSAYERSRAERVASKVQGVTYVDNRLTVERNDRLP